MCTRRATFILLLAAIFLVPGVATARPERVVSLFLCTDELLIRLADRGNIASVSYWAANPDISNVAPQTAGLHLNHGLAEEILPLRPDLVLSGEFTARGATDLLRKLGFQVEVIPVANGFDDIRRNIRRVAELIGVAARGAALIAEFDRRLDRAARNLPPGPRPVAAYYWTGGFSAGSGTLAEAVLARAGFRNYATRSRTGPGGRFPLELIVTARVDALVLGEWSSASPSMSRNMLRHPALDGLSDRVPTVRLSRRLLACGTPAVAGAVEQLARMRREMAER